jgi:3-oxoacyl-[acyl-carrier protein] reductase
MNLENAKVLITGGSSGLGLATAKLLLNDGAKVCITGRDEDKLIRVATEIGASYIVFDQTDFESIPGKISDAISQLGGIDVLINNAGQGWRKELGEITIDDFQQIYGANVFGLTMVTQEVLPLFKKQNKGHIINIASTAALRGYPTGSVYASSKFALRGLTECWRAELRKFNIRVMLVNPSEVPTAFGQDSRMERPDESGKLTSYEIAHTIKSILAMDDRGFVPEVTVWATNPNG